MSFSFTASLLAGEEDFDRARDYYPCVWWDDDRTDFRCTGFRSYVYCVCARPNAYFGGCGNTFYYEYWNQACDQGFMCNPEAENYDDEFCIRVPDEDNDRVPDHEDNCPDRFNENQADNDRDGFGDVCDDDDDNDGVRDNRDNCPFEANRNQADRDDDGIGDECDNSDDRDRDGDGDPDDRDNCPDDSNSNQRDTDNDGRGDVCDSDDDNDRILDRDDNCPLNRNPNQEDLDEDGQGDVCDQDDDGDGIRDNRDNCPFERNPEQNNHDGDQFGDLCDDDDDNDQVLDENDNCPFNENPNQSDHDNDGLGDLCDSDDDNDGLENNREIELGTDPFNPDTDRDGVLDGQEIEMGLNPLVPDNPAVALVLAMINSDDDRDEDGIPDDDDNCPDVANPEQRDANEDGVGDLCEVVAGLSSPDCPFSSAYTYSAYPIHSYYDFEKEIPQSLLQFFEKYRSRFTRLIIQDKKIRDSFIEIIKEGSVYLEYRKKIIDQNFSKKLQSFNKLIWKYDQDLSVGLESYIKLIEGQSLVEFLNQIQK